ncbi:MAG: PTS-dependent dihydroxyacetone kinase phosphotransferase subunit DhaM [Halanaerobiales bacterium]|nr:PTS-dependent dihydroxyacetone kinase phosphotransferase subunit DhaM [Halanaerobiales bacterium]
MVGIVIVSHSSKVAQGAKDIALQMAGDVFIVACGGNPEGGIGTNSEEISAGIASVYSEDGVVVLADLGSAVMSAEMILDSLTPEKREKVIIANAPIVEGAVMAAVEASMGMNLDQVLAAAENASKMVKVEREG